MLITTCTHCLARFRVTPQQLNVKQGQVRCGRCRKVFNGFGALERYPDDDTGARLLAAREAAMRAAHPLETTETLDLEDEVATPSPETPVPEDASPAPAPVTPAPAAGARPPRRPVAFEEIEPFTPPPPSRAWRLGVALLLVVLGVEAVYGLRGTLAQRYPIVRPWLESACARAGCDVPWSRDESLLKLEDSELLEVPGKPNQIALGARIRNLAAVAQELPHLELTLTDLTGQAAVRRVLRPPDYLGRVPGSGEVLGPGAEIAIQMRLETRTVRATGYELLLFYP